MKTLKAILFFTFFIPFSSQAQNTEAKWSNEYFFDAKKDGIPWKSIGGNKTSSFVLFNDSKKEGKKHLSIKSYSNSSTQESGKANLLSLFPSVANYKFKRAGYTKDGIYVSWINEKKDESEVWVAVLDNSLKIKTALTKLYSASTKPNKETVKVASFDVQISKDEQSDPLAIILEHSCGLKEKQLITAVSYDASLAEKSSKDLTVDLNWSSDKTLLTGQTKIYQNAFNYLYSKNGVFGYLNTYRVSFYSKGLPFVHFDLDNKKSVFKTINHGKTSSGKMFVKPSKKGIDAYFTGSTGDGVNKITLISLSKGLNIELQNENVFTAEQLKKAFKNYDFAVSKKGKRKFGTGNPVYSPITIHPYNKIEDVVSNNGNHFLSLSFFFYKRDANGRVIKDMKSGLLVVKLNPKGKIDFMINHERFYTNKLGKPGSLGADSKLIINSNGDLFCAFYSDINSNGEELEGGLLNNSFQVIKLNPIDGKLVNSSTIKVNDKGYSVAKGIGLKKSGNNFIFLGNPKSKKGRIGIVEIK